MIKGRRKPPTRVLTLRILTQAFFTVLEMRKA